MPQRGSQKGKPAMPVWTKVKEFQPVELEGYRKPNAPAVQARLGTDVCKYLYLDKLKAFMGKVIRRMKAAWHALKGDDQIAFQLDRRKRTWKQVDFDA